MGTRSLTIVKDYDESEIIVMYRQFDGYPEGHGLELAEFLAPFKIVNGIAMDDKRKIANGMGCLAAQLVAHFKGEEPGGFYLYPSGTRDCGEDYIYIVDGNELGEPITIRCEGEFDGTPEAFIEKYGNAPAEEASHGS